MDEVDTTPIDVHLSKTKSHKNIVSLLCLLALSVTCWGFVCASFLQIPGKTRTFIVYRRLYIVEINMHIVKNMVEFLPSVKHFNRNWSEIRSSVDTNSSIVNDPSEFLPLILANSIQSQNTRRSIYTNKINNDIYQRVVTNRKNNESS